MTLFWITAAALTAIAILFVVLPILKYKKVEETSSDELNIEIIKQQLAELEADMEAGELEEEQYTASRHDLEKALLADLNSGSSEQTGEVKSGRWAIYAIPVVIIAIALPTYFKIGSPDIIPYLDSRPTQHQSTAQGHAQQRAAGQPNTSMEELVVSLAARMESDPENIEGWKMLGRSYISMGRIHDALQAYERALNLDRKDVDLLMGYATTLAMSRDNQFQGLPAELIDQAYQIAPQNPNVLWLKGNIHYQAGDFQQAIVIWEQVMAKLQPGSEEATTVADYIKDARSRLPAGTVAPVAAPASTTESSSSKATAAEAIRVIVSLDPALQDKIQGNETLFIFARPITGPRVPLAVVRKKASDLPITLVMDDSMAMSGQLSLSKYPQVKVEARITKSGKPSASSGDLEGLVSPVKPGQAETVNLVINTVNP